ncbi:MAG: SWIM zinc finger family protein, partial [Actinomycetota bacterium]
MQISINDLESLIDPTVLRRGKDYFKRGLVAELEEVENDRWSALVEGTQTYEVRVKLEGDRIAESLCDCPYDFGPVCKHEVAVYLAIGHMLAGNDLPEKKKKRSKTKPKRKTIADKISDIVAKLAEEEMREIVLEYALNDREFRNTLLAQDLLKRDEADKNKKEDYKRIMRDSLRSSMDRHGFIGYWSSSRAIRGIEDLVYEANKMLIEQKPESAVPIYQAAIEETVPALQYADDSSGDLGGVIELSFEKLNECAEDIADKNVRKDLFEYALKAAKDKIYDGWSDWQWEWLGIASKLIGNLEEKKKLLQKIDELATASQIE